VQAETAIKAAIETAAATGDWRLAETDCEAVDSILQQLEDNIES
jgi:hypothetical protein